MKRGALLHHFEDLFDRELTRENLVQGALPEGLDVARVAPFHAPKEGLVAFFALSWGIMSMRGGLRETWLADRSSQEAIIRRRKAMALFEHAPCLAPSVARMMPSLTHPVVSLCDDSI